MAGASAPGWERSLTGLTDERCNVAAAASEFDSELELAATTAEDEAAVFLCAEMSPTAARPRINKIATTPPMRRMRISRAHSSNARGLFTGTQTKPKSPGAKASAMLDRPSSLSGS
jgi:hypothetical protein